MGVYADILRKIFNTDLGSCDLQEPTRAPCIWMSFGNLLLWVPCNSQEGQKIVFSLN